MYINRSPSLTKNTNLIKSKLRKIIPKILFTDTTTGKDTFLDALIFLANNRTITIHNLQNIL